MANIAVKYNTLLILTVICALLNSCKLDSVPPGMLNGNNDENTVLGINVVGKNIYDGYLTASWKVSLTVLEYYDEDNIVISGEPAANIFSGVAIIDNVKKLDYANMPSNNAPASGTYVLSTTDNVLFMKLSDDPFSRSENTPVRITRLNSASMVWVAIEPKSTLLNGKSVHKAYRIIFYK